MLQRLQTVFLLLIILAMIAFSLLPCWQKIDLDTLQRYTLIAWGLTIENPNEKFYMMIYRPYLYLGCLAVLITCIAGYEIFCFNNRIKQLKLGTLNSLLLTGLVGSIVYMTNQGNTNWLPELVGHFKAGFYMPLVAVVCNFCANYFIRKDEELVQSANRIR
jgi:hypothetical protein